MNYDNDNDNDNNNNNMNMMMMMNDVKVFDLDRIQTNRWFMSYLTQNI